MILTLTWKEYREHRSIWLAMVVMTGVVALVLSQLVAAEGPPGARFETAAIAVLGLAITYGVVCGSMMFAGEREAGTLTFLDIFLGRRGLLWFGKFLLGVVFVLAEALAVALVLWLTKQSPPEWLRALVRVTAPDAQQPAFLPAGVPDAAQPGPDLWFRVLPVVTLEAYAWGLLGSSFTRRVLSGAAVAALLAAPLCLIVLFTPPPGSVVLRVLAVGVALGLSVALFLAQSREVSQPAPLQDAEPHPLQARLQDWERPEKFELERRAPRLARPAAEVVVVEEIPVRRTGRGHQIERGPRPTQASSPGQVLWWLTARQALVLFWALPAAAVVVGLLVPFSGQLLWPAATLLLGLVCGTATFSQEQSDLSYQFLAVQHFPLKKFWSVKIQFWAIAAALSALLAAGVAGLAILMQLRPHPPEFLGPPRLDFTWGTLEQLLGPVLYFGVWAVYGFAAGHVFVLFCRKTILAVLLAGMASVFVIALWLSALLCGGMSGWQVWVPPLLLVAATWFLVRAWAGGRIKERRPLAAALGFGLAALVWVGLNLGLRALEIPEVGAPLDRKAFRASIPTKDGNQAAQLIQQALGEMDNPEGKEGPGLAGLARAVRLPPGVLEMPSAEGQAPVLLHLPKCEELTRRLLTRSRQALAAGQPGPALDYLAQVLALSRTLRNKAPVASYLAGIEAETDALKGLDFWLAQRKPDRLLLQRALDELNRHAAQTPAPLDCLRTECYRAGGLLDIPAAWNLANPGAVGGVPERWLAGWVALSLETPWENERKERLWRAVWAGLFRGLQSPYGRLEEDRDDFPAGKETTRRILRGWLPGAEGPTRADLARLLDDSWLSDGRLFAPVLRLRRAATRARWRLDSCRLKVALALYQLQEGKPARRLGDLVPKYLAELPADPYSGEAYHYRLSHGERLTTGKGEFQGRNGVDKDVVRPGQGVLWSTGPDRVDDGGRKHGGALRDDDPGWVGGGYDLIAVVPVWP